MKSSLIKPRTLNPDRGFDGAAVAASKVLEKVVGLAALEVTEPDPVRQMRVCIGAGGRMQQQCAGPSE